MTVNKVILVGRLGADPEMRHANSGTAIANLRIATTDRRKDRDGNWGEHTEWHTVTAFGRTAETVGRFLTKGRQVYIEGKLRTRKWQDKEGRDRWSTEVVADAVQFLGGKGEGGGGQRGGYGGGGQRGGGYSSGGGGKRDGSGYSNRAPSPAPAPASAQGGSFVDDDLPF